MTTDDVFKYAGAVYTKQRLVAEWNWNRFARSLTRPGEVILYRAPNETQEHALYIDPDGNMIPVGGDGEPMYTNTPPPGLEAQQGLWILDPQAPSDYITSNDGAYLTIDDVRIAVGSDETETTDEDGNEIKVAPDGKIIPQGDEGAIYTFVNGTDTYLAYEDGTPIISDITGGWMLVSEAMDLKERRTPVSTGNAPRNSNGIPYEESDANGYFDYDKDLFPLESIIEADRPDKPGLQKAWAGDKSTSTGILSKTPGRFYTATEDAKYKYWLSGTESESNLQTTGNGDGYAIGSVGVKVNYDRPLVSNKIVIGLETGVVSGIANEPAWSRVYAEVDNGYGRPVWRMIKENPAVVDGKIILYYNGVTEWVQSQTDLSQTVNIMSLRYEVYRMKRPGSHLSLVEMSLRLERDLTDYMVSWTADSSMTDHSFVAPMGTISSNTASVVLSNLDGRFDKDNKFLLRGDRVSGLMSDTPNEFYKIVDRNIGMRLDVAVSETPFEADTVVEWNRIFTMTTDTWSIDGSQATAALKDDSILLQGLKPNPFFLEQFNKSGVVTAMQVIYRLLDSVGYTNYNINKSDYDKVISMEYYWTDGESTVWDAITEICQSTQMAVYFDNYGVMQFQTLPTMYSQASSDIVLTTQDLAGGARKTLANIVSVTKDGEYEANTVNITYKRTRLTDTTPSGIEPLDQVWEPDGNQVLRASPLVSPLKNQPRSEVGSDYSLRIPAEDAKSWPFAGIVNIDGELIRYNAKKYYYYDSDGKHKYKYVTSQSQVAELDERNPTLAFKNAYNGRLRIQNRGLWNTYTKAHNVDINGWWCRYRRDMGAVREWRGGVRHDKNNSTMLMRAPKNFTNGSTYVAMNGSQNDAMINYFGTRLRFPSSGYTDGAAGIAVGLGNNDSGIYIELARTSMVSRDKRKHGNELRVWVKYANGDMVRWHGDKGVATGVAKSRWYDLDVYYDIKGNDVIVYVMVNGVGKQSFTIDGIVDKSGMTGLAGGRYGMFIRGDTWADFEYFYANNRRDDEELDEGSFWDRITGAWQSQSERENQLRSKTAWRYNRKKHIKYNYRYAQLFFDDFGPYVHEMREYNVKFDKAPAVFSKVYFSNDSQAVCTEYRHGPFGAYFMLGNASRNNAVVNGDDNLTYGPDNTVTQRLLVFARVIQQDDDSTISVRDEGAVARRGEVALDINAPWVQSDDAAKQLASYVLAAWSQPSMSFNLELFGDLRLQLGKKVTLYAPESGIGEEGLDSTSVANINTYVVNEVSHSFNNGITTTVNIRSVNPGSVA